MKAPTRVTAAASVAALLVGAGLATAFAAADQAGTAVLTGRAVLPSDTFRAGSAPSGAFFSVGDRTSARNNGLTVPDTGAVFTQQPVQGLSAVIPTGAPGEYFAMSDNGYGARGNSADWELWVNKVSPQLARGAAAPGTVTVTGGFGLSDPGRKVPWTIACDPATGSALPPFDFNRLPASPPDLCGDPAQRRLTGFDFDLESMQVAKDGTFWFGEEFGPFLLHTDRSGRLLEAPIPVPGATSPQNPTLDVLGGERPTVNGSKGLEGMAISPDRRTLYPLLEGAVTGDDPRDLRVYVFDIASRTFSGYDRIRLELPSTVANTSTLRLNTGALAYPGDVPPPPTTGKSAIGELTAVNDHQALLLERDNGGDFPNTPRFKAVFTVELGEGEGELLPKRPLVNEMAIPDATGTGGDGDYFRFPFTTIESVFPLSSTEILIACDNNYPFSNGRSFSKGGSPGNGLRPDDNEFIRVKVSPGLSVDKRVLTAPTGR
jgi:hypothetical protein